MNLTLLLFFREADRVILTTCQQEGANQNTFQSVSTLLGNKTPSEVIGCSVFSLGCDWSDRALINVSNSSLYLQVSRRFSDLMRLFRTAARQTSSEDEAPPTELAAANKEDS